MATVLAVLEIPLRTLEATRYFFKASIYSSAFSLADKSLHACFNFQREDLSNVFLAICTVLNNEHHCDSVRLNLFAILML
ncbi:MAG: hypothetical protein MJ219_02110 [Mycoplasmoidaceae bacterium]|nr:hypothetical protein [Mycoplasmoidaceae bacterium]